MENASKALLIVGGVLIAMLILSIGVYLIGNLGNTADTYVTELDIVELNKYNSNFEVFIGRKDITAQEIVTLISLAKQKEQGTIIIVDGNDCTSWNEQQKSEFLQNTIQEYKNNGNVTLFSYVEIVYDEINGKVSKMLFKKI